MSFDLAYSRALMPFRTRLLAAAVCSGVVGLAAVALLGLSGWFLAGAAVAGAAGPIAVQAFNYLLPAALIRFLAIARTGARYGERYLSHSAALNAVASLRPALFAGLAAQPAERALSLSRGEAAGRLVDDVGVLENALVARSAIAGSAGGALVAALLCALANPWAGVAYLTIALATVLIIRRLVRHPKHDNGSQAAMGALKARFNEITTILPDVRTCDLRAPLLRELDELETLLAKSRAGVRDRAALVPAFLLVASGIGQAAVVVLCLHSGIASLALAVFAAAAGFESLDGLGRALAEEPVETEAKQRIADIFTADATAAAAVASAFILPAERIRLDGPSGSGKTQRIETLVGLRGGTRVSGRFALCPQDAMFLTGTLRSNLLMARPDADQDALWRALDDACLSERVHALPNGLETWVGDGGVALSGGERKRLALARALLRPAPTLVLDEPTEGLDPATERQVVDNLAARLKRTGQGLILVSHRQAPRALTDATGRIVVLN